MNKKQRAFLEILKNTLGVVTQACEKFGISTVTFYNWKNNNEQFREKVEEINERAIDFVESQMFKQIEDGNSYLTWKFLSTRGRSRGYSEKTELDVGWSGPVQIIETTYSPADEELEAGAETLSLDEHQEAD